MNSAFIATLIMPIFFSAALAESTTKPSVAEERSEKQWHNKHNYLASLVRQASRKPPMDIFFLGDSLTEFWPEMGKSVWAAEFGKLSVLNCGVAGDTTQNILYRITHGELDGIAPKVIVLLAGINNLGLSPNLAPAELAQGLKAIVSTLRAKSPGSKILLLSIFPTADPVQTRIKETNKLLAELADQKSVFFLDIYNSFLDAEKRFPAAISPDGLHLNAKGYQIWADAMRPTLLKLLAEHALPAK